MIYQVKNIMKDVRVCIDQNMVSEPLLDAGDVDTLSLDEIIRSKIVDGVRRVHLMAPTRLLEGGNNIEKDVFWMENESGFVLLPSDFLRLVAFEMDDWERAVYKPITPEDPQYALQRSRFKGIRGTSQNPVCVLTERAGQRALEFYSCYSEQATITRAVYIPEPSIDSEGGIWISKYCYESVKYMISALVMTAFGDKEKASTLIELSKLALE